MCANISTADCPQLLKNWIKNYLITYNYMLCYAGLKFPPRVLNKFSSVL